MLYAVGLQEMAIRFEGLDQHVGSRLRDQTGVKYVKAQSERNPDQVKLHELRFPVFSISDFIDEETRRIASDIDGCQ